MRTGTLIMSQSSLFLVIYFLFTVGGDYTFYSCPLYFEEVASKAWDHTISPNSLTQRANEDIKARVRHVRMAKLVVSWLFFTLIYPKRGTQILTILCIEGAVSLSRDHRSVLKNWLNGIVKYVVIFVGVTVFYIVCDGWFNSYHGNLWFIIGEMDISNFLEYG